VRYRLSLNAASQYESRCELLRVSKPKRRNENRTSRARGCVLQSILRNIGEIFREQQT
jgi:hypothetical protein